MRKLIAGLLLCAFVFAAWPAGASANCRVVKGQKITLFGTADDPDVLVWDLRERLIEYSQGSLDTARILLPHAMLVRPGTKAVITACFRNQVRPKYSITTQDAVGIFILTGEYKGRYGWVKIADVR